MEVKANINITKDNIGRNCHNILHQRLLDDREFQDYLLKKKKNLKNRNMPMDGRASFNATIKLFNQLPRELKEAISHKPSIEIQTPPLGLSDERNLIDFEKFTNKSHGKR